MSYDIETVNCSGRFERASWGAWLFITACGGATTADDRAWPPPALGGRELLRGPLDDPALDPATGLPYDDNPFCEGPTQVLRRGERVQLNEGDSVTAASVARWEGSYRCELSTAYAAGSTLSYAKGPTLQLDVRRVDEPALTCPGRGGGLLLAAAAVSMRLTDTDGTPLQDGPCSSLATVSIWPGRTNLQVTCSELVIELRADWVRIAKGEPPATETTIYLPECHAERGD